MAEWAGVDCVQTIGTVEVPTLKCLEGVYRQILTVVLSIAVLALFIMLITGGFRYLTSKGDPKAAQTARQTMTYAMIGIVLLVLAYIGFALIKVFTGVDVFKFEIPV